MEKRNYVKPILNSETFIPSEYIAVCYTLKCNTSAANAYESSIGNTPIGGHSSWGCGNKTHQSISVGENGILNSAKENDHPYWDPLEMIFITELPDEKDGETVRETPFAVKNGDIVYWITQNGDNKYYHQGQIELTDANKTVNHS